MLKKIFPYYWLLGSIVFAACENSEQAIQAMSSRGAMKDEATKIESYLTQGGKIKARLTAPTMVRISNDSTYTEFPKTLHVDFYSPERIIETRLDSKYGKYLETQRKVYLRDSVVVITNKGDTLLCQDLWWDQNTEKFYTYKKALYWSPTQRQAGEDGLVATQNLKTVSFLNNHGKVVTKEGDVPK